MNEYSSNVNNLSKELAATKIQNQTNNNKVTVTSDEKPPLANIDSRAVLQKAVQADDFVPRAQHYHNQQQHYYNTANTPPTDEKPPTIQRQISDDEWLSGTSGEEKVQLLLHDHVMTLTENPGMFHNVIKELAPVLSQHVRTEELMKETLFVIFEHVSLIIIPLNTNVSCR